MGTRPERRTGPEDVADSTRPALDMSHDTRPSSLGHNAKNPRGSAPELPQYLRDVAAPYLHSFTEGIPPEALVARKAIGMLAALIQECGSKEELHRLGYALMEAGRNVRTITAHYNSLVERDIASAPVRPI